MKRRIEGIRILHCKTFVITFLLSGVFFFCLVYTSNHTLHAEISALHSAGHTVVPNASVRPLLLQPQTAFLGSLFFTLTAGLVSAFALSLFAGIIRKKKEGLPIGDILRPLAIHFFCAAFVCTLFYLYTDSHFFIKARDMLFSTNPGRVAADFYYRYTLYAAQAIQSPFQKQIKPFRMDPETKGAPAIERSLFKNGWLQTDSPASAGLVIEFSEGTLFFKDKKTRVVSVSFEKFFKEPEAYLKRFSTKTDRSAPLRMVCRWALIPGVPVVVVFVLSLCLETLFEKGAGFRRANLISGPAALLLLMGMLFFIVRGTEDIPAGRMAGMIASERMGQTVRALRYLESRGESIWRFQGAATALLQGETLERYWLARVLGNTYSRESVRLLKILARDKNLAVRIAAVKGLSQADFTAPSFNLFQKIIQQDTEWYVQYYAWNGYKQWKIKNSRH